MRSNAAAPTKMGLVAEGDACDGALQIVESGNEAWAG